MRPEFRLWDNRNQRYYKVGRRDGIHGKKAYWFNVQSNGEVIIGYDDIIDEPGHVSDFILEQSAGLTDKNGEMIYEGDVIKNHQASDNNVIWFNGSWCMENFHAGALTLANYNECSEIIGNIHNTKEDGE